jgi:hypothetical protein
MLEALTALAMAAALGISLLAIAVLRFHKSARLRSSNSPGCGVNQRLDFLRKTPPVRAEFVEQNRTEQYVAVLATLI